MKRSIILFVLHPFFISANAQKETKPITLRTMGSFFFGGSVTTAENGESFHGDHGYAQYFIPQKSRSYPIVMWPRDWAIWQNLRIYTRWKRRISVNFAPTKLVCLYH